MTIDTLNATNAKRRFVAPIRHFRQAEGSGNSSHLLVERLDTNAKREMLPDARVFVLERAIDGKPELEVDLEHFNNNGRAILELTEYEPGISPGVIRKTVALAMGAAQVEEGLLAPATTNIDSAVIASAFSAAPQEGEFTLVRAA